MKPSAHNRWLERSFNKEDEPFDLGGSFSRDTVQPVTSFASCQQDQRLGGGPNLSSKACCPFFDVCFAEHLAGLPPAPWSGGTAFDFKVLQPIISASCQFASLRLVLTGWFLGTTSHGTFRAPVHTTWFSFLGTWNHASLRTLLCFVFWLSVTLTHVASTSLFKTTFSVAPWYNNITTIYPINSRRFGSCAILLYPSDRGYF